MDYGRIVWFLRHHLKRLLLLLTVLSTLVMVVITYSSRRHLSTVGTVSSFLSENHTYLDLSHSTDGRQIVHSQRNAAAHKWTSENVPDGTFQNHGKALSFQNEQLGRNQNGQTLAYQNGQASGFQNEEIRALQRGHAGAFKQGHAEGKNSSFASVLKPSRAKPKTTREWLSAAAADIRCTYVPDVDKFAQDAYFHPSHKLGQASTPNVVINPINTCRKGSPLSSLTDDSSTPSLLVLVLSGYRHNDIEERQAVRDTYGSVSRGGRWPGKPVLMDVRLLFLMGRPPSQAARLHIDAESAEFGDILMGDFLDSYENLTLKVLFGLQWAVSNCPQAGFVLKADDDTFVNLPLLTTFLLERGQPNSVYGHVYFTSRVVRGGRWAVSREVYPLENYPPYMSGTAYVLSLDAARSIVRASELVPFIPIEDAYITGVLAVVAGVRRMFTSGFTHFAEKRADLCQFVLDARLVSNKMAAMDKHNLWNTLRIDDRRLCDAQNHIPRT